MPLIEIINITLLAFSVGLLALMGISYLVYRYRESVQKPVIENSNAKEQLITKEIKTTEKQSEPAQVKNNIVLRYQIVKTYSQSIPFEKKQKIEAEKFLVVNKNIPSLRKTHSPKFIYLVSSPSNR
ncbi:MAG: hypothetical protein ACK4UV_00190 [Ignavibacterium sp.]